jgi:glycosyltransferase involved in cell wall biosynthesis
MNNSPQKLKILIIAPALPLVGGQAVQAQRLVAHLRREPNLEVGFQANNPVFLPRLQQIKFVRTVLTVLKYWFDLFRQIPRYDIIHVFSPSYFTFVYASMGALVVAKIFGKKAIINYRSGEAEDFFSRWGKPLLLVLRRFDAIITPSEYLVDVFAKFDVKAASINNFISLEKYIYRDRTPLRPIFLSNRSLEPLYNIDCILRAFQIIQNKFPQAELVVAHEGKERERLENVSAHLNLRNVEFTGLVPQEKIQELYNAADIYLNTPNFDCMPGSLIECFASGLPIVSTNAGGIPYIVRDGETGLLVECGDHEALAEKATLLLENERYARKIIEQARTESEKYSWEHVGEKWIALYEKLAGQKIADEEKFPTIQAPLKNQQTEKKSDSPAAAVAGSKR